METYIGFKMLECEAMTAEMAFSVLGRPIDTGDAEPNEAGDVEGYLVEYPGGYQSWSPKAPFDKAHMLVPGDGTKITEEMVEDFVDSYEVQKMGDKTTVVLAKLKNGFVIVESSSCVDPANYDEEIGAGLCEGLIKRKIWNLLGFLLQTAKVGVSPAE